MNLFFMGGWMMWPLLALSILALAVIIERAMFYASLGFPSSLSEERLASALEKRDFQQMEEAFTGAHSLFQPFFREISKLSDPSAAKASGEEAQAASEPIAENREHEILNLLGQEVLARLDRGLPLLGVIVRAAPLMGLLGTVLGMINTFSRLAATQGGVDLMVLAEGIWQALLTTAAGLLIAIPVLLARHWFVGRKRRVGEALFRTAGAALILREPSLTRGRP